MPETIVGSNKAIEALLNMLRRRLEDAVKNGQRVSMNARAGMKRGSFTEEDGSFHLDMYIDPRP